MKNIENYIEKKLNFGNNYDVIKRQISRNTIMYYLSSLVDFTSVNQIIEGMILKK